MSTIDLTHSQQLSKLLQKHHLFTQKKYGQNFLINRSVITDSIKAANLQPTDIVLEIGTGSGVLTQQLAIHAQQVYTFEVDPSLQPLLEETLAEYSNIDLQFQDFKLADLTNIIKDNSYKVVANLPYNAGTHIIGQLIQQSHLPQSITVLLQKEVAQKITATPPHATYLSNFISLFGKAEIIRIVPPNSFFPAPKVDSAVLHIQRHPASAILPAASVSRFLHRGFANPRKKINKAFTPQELAQANIDPNLRPENLSLDDWLRLFAVTTN